MSEDWLPPKEHYNIVQEDYDKQARASIEALCSELDAKGDVLSEHGLLIKRRDTWLEVVRGELGFVLIAFNFDKKGGCRVINYLDKEINHAPILDYASAEEGFGAFKKQIRIALDLFYQNKSRFVALGLA